MLGEVCAYSARLANTTERIIMSEEIKDTLPAAETVAEEIEGATLGAEIEETLNNA